MYSVLTRKEMGASQGLQQWTTTYAQGTCISDLLLFPHGLDRGMETQKNKRWGSGTKKSEGGGSFRKRIQSTFSPQVPPPKGYPALMGEGTAHSK